MIHLWVLALLVSITQSAEEWNPKKVDFIIIGAGPAGSAIASRLSENKSYKVALVEAGGEPNYLTNIPYRSLENFFGEHNWNYSIEPQENAFLGYTNKECTIPRGKGLGGSTLVNAMMYTRGNRKDYDNWAALGNEGWDYKSLLPYFLKIENYDTPLVYKEDAPFHHKGGSVTVTHPRYTTQFTQVFLDAAQETGLPINDYNSKTQTGVTHPMFTISNGTRHSAYTSYLKDARGRKNLHIITNAHATKILFNKNKKAKGVIFVRNGKSFVIRSTKEIVLSAGAIGSPQLLLLSGVGPKKTLKKHNIPVVADVPGVGQNFQDHVTTAGIYVTVDEPNFGFKPNEVNAGTMELWKQKRQGPMTSPNRVEGLGFFNTKYNNEKDFPDIEITSYQPPTLPAPLTREVSRSLFPNEQKNIIHFSPVVMRPLSRGYLTLKNVDPFTYPIIQPNFLSEKMDVNLLVEGVRLVLDLVNTTAFKQHGLKFHGHVLPQCSSHVDQSDEYWECFVRHMTVSFFHASGTCKMAPKSDKMGVVDPELRLRGVSGIRVADVSIMPNLMTGHTMIPAYVIGEKATDLIIANNKVKCAKLKKCENRK